MRPLKKMSAGALAFLSAVALVMLTSAPAQAAVEAYWLGSTAPYVYKDSMARSTLSGGKSFAGEGLVAITVIPSLKPKPEIGQIAAAQAHMSAATLNHYAQPGYSSCGHYPWRPPSRYTAMLSCQTKY